MSSLYELNRRTFLGAGTTAGFMMAGQPAGLAAAGSERDEWPKLRPAKIYKLYIGRSGAATNAAGKQVQYLNWGQEEVIKMDNYLQNLEKQLGDVTFVGGDTIPKVDAAQVAARAASADGMLLVWLGGHGGDYATLEKLNFGVDKPAVSFFQPFSGHGWMWHQQWKNRKVVLLSTTDWKELDEAVSLLRVPALMKQTRILAVNGPRGTKASCSAEEVRKKLGAELITIKNQEILDLAKSIDSKAAEAEAENYWIKPAIGILEPTREEIIDSARYYLAVKQLMIKERAQGICSAACMGTPRACLTFSKLNDLGLVGACEGDIDSTLTMLLFAHAFRTPGFITDPVVDEGKNALVQFHCTSFTKRPDGSRMPYLIRNQTDSGGGVALQVQWQVGEPVTMAKLVNLDTMLMVPGKITETGSSPLACRTQFTQTVRDARHLFLNWGGNVIVPPGSPGDISQYAGAMPMLHRAVFYGNHMRGVRRLGDLMGFKVLEEDIAT
jgi:predicted SnoaL-like aldol condensation-catalyzing enzyme